MNRGFKWVYLAPSIIIIIIIKHSLPTTMISLVLTKVVGVLFFVSTISQQTFAQDTYLTIKEALEKSFGKENGEESEERGYYKLKTGGEKERE